MPTDDVFCTLTIKLIDMPKTGEKCQIAGIYKCSLHTSHQITMPKGHTFPPCDKSGPAKDHAADWVVVQVTQH